MSQNMTVAVSPSASAVKGQNEFVREHYRMYAWCLMSSLLCAAGNPGPFDSHSRRITA